MSEKIQLDPNLAQNLQVIKIDGSEFRIEASDGVAGSRFGSSVDLKDEAFLIGAPRDTEIANRSGAAYISDCKV